MKLERTHDMEVVGAILAHPAIAPHIGDDGATDHAPMDYEGFHWMLVTSDDGSVGGVFLVHAANSFTYEMHTCLLPSMWGAPAKAAAKLLGDWVFDETACEKLVTKVPVYNRKALRFAKAGGMVEEGNNRASFKRNGTMIDQIILGITKQEWTTCQQHCQ